MRDRRQTTRERRCESTHERQTRDDESIVARERRCESICSIYCCLSRLYLYLASPLLSPLASLVPPLLTHTDTNMGLLYSQTFPQETPAYPPSEIHPGALETHDHTRGHLTCTRLRLGVPFSLASPGNTRTPPGPSSCSPLSPKVTNRISKQAVHRP